MRGFLILTIAFWAGSAQAQTNLAQDGLQATIQQLATDPDANGFELGMLQTLRAVEKTLQARYEYGLGDQISGMPLLRLNARGQRNPSPKPSTAGTLSTIIDNFVTDMAAARALLEHAESQGIAPFALTLTDIWFDINANGTRESVEDAVTSLGAAILGERAYRDFAKSDPANQPLIVRFDEADHAWLLAYTHMLSGFGNLYMAFDPTSVFRDLSEQRAALADAPQTPEFYNLDAVRAEIVDLTARKAEIDLEFQDLQKRIYPIYRDLNQLQTKLRTTEDDAVKKELRVQISILNSKMEPLHSKQSRLSRESREFRNEITAAEEKLPEGIGRTQAMMLEEQDAIDMLYVVLTALAQQPDPARIRATHQHLKAMIANNRIFWARLAGETDNDREWIPNDAQQSVLPLTIPRGMAEGWQNILADIEAMLDGKLLIPHPVLPVGYGISLPAYVENPGPLDLVGWAHGISAYRYAAKGPRLTLQRWRAFARLTSGNAGGFALFFN